VEAAPITIVSDQEVLAILVVLHHQVTHKADTLHIIIKAMQRPGQAALAGTSTVIEDLTEDQV
jgi:hypothetical protein